MCLLCNWKTYDILSGKSQKMPIVPHHQPHCSRRVNPLLTARKWPVVCQHQRYFRVFSSVCISDDQTVCKILDEMTNIMSIVRRRMQMTIESRHSLTGKSLAVALISIGGMTMPLELSLVKQFMQLDRQRQTRGSSIVVLLTEREMTPRCFSEAQLPLCV